MSIRLMLAVPLTIYGVLAVLVVVSSYRWTILQEGGTREDFIKLASVWVSLLTAALTAWMSFLVLKLQKSSALEIEHLKAELTALQNQDVYIRELYAGDIRRYSSQQAEALRRAYLLLFEPESAGIGTVPDIEERLELARQIIMRPLRKHLGVLDESTIRRIYSVHNRLLDLGALPPEELRNRKNDFFNQSEVARRFIKVDKIAFRLGLTTRALEERKLYEE